MPHDHLYLTHQPTIDRALRFTARRHRCGADEAEDFAAWARLRLVENDYAILAKCKDPQRMSSYLAVAIPRLFLDYRIAKWGKWRPSAEAKRLGALGVALETLVAREGLRWEDAYQTLLGREPGLSREAVEEILARLPARGPRQFEGEGALEALPDPGAGPEAAAIASEEGERKRRAHGVLAEVVAALPPQDQIVLRLRFVEEMQIADIARTLHLEARPLYRRIERLTAELRRGLAERGVGPGDFLWGSGGEERAGLGPRRAVSPRKQARSSRLDGE